VNSLNGSGASPSGGEAEWVQIARAHLRLRTLQTEPLFLAAIEFSPERIERFDRRLQALPARLERPVADDFRSGNRTGVLAYATPDPAGEAAGHGRRFPTAYCPDLTSTSIQ
jgi:hypothetical protein